MLALELELLTGAYRAALPDGSGAEWPPHPERIFSAFVQAWGDGGRRDDERDALEWLEALEAPRIEASAASERDAPIAYVPPNDLKGSEVEALPDRRRRQQRTFHAVLPHDPLLRLWWSDEAPSPHRAPLEALARRVASVGHSTSFVRAAFRFDASEPATANLYEPDVEQGDLAIRMPYGGRLSDLERWFSTEGGKKAERPRTLDVVRYRGPSPVRKFDPKASVFGCPEDWFVFEDASLGFRPDVLAFGHVSRQLRRALMDVGADPVPEALSGHAASGAPSAEPHVAIVPLGNWGWPHSNGDLLGLALVLPRGLVGEARRAVLASVAAWLAQTRDRDAVGPDTLVGRVRLTKDRAWDLVREPRPTRASLQPERWCRAARKWASVTPVLLDRFPKSGEAEEEAAIIASACANIGLPDPITVEIHKHSGVSGAPTCYPARGRSSLPDWSFPAEASYRERVRRHVVLHFAEPVRGPVLLGAGRYHGFGLCLPIPEDA